MNVDRVTHRTARMKLQPFFVFCCGKATIVWVVYRCMTKHGSIITFQMVAILLFAATRKVFLCLIKPVFVGTTTNH